MAKQLIENILKDRGERVQQPQIQEFLEFIEEICPGFSQLRTLDVAVWKEVGMRIQQHYCNYGPESIPEDTAYFWMLIQERLDLNPDQQETVPSTPPEELPEGGCITKESCKSRDLEGVIEPLTRAKAHQDSEKV